jgi:hypothetical protein
MSFDRRWDQYKRGREGGDGDYQCPPMALGSLIVCDQCTLHGLAQADAYGLRRK